MAAEEARLREKQFSHIRRLKRLMRPLPRHATLHRYPFLKWFTVFARKRAYLWSFRTKHTVPAFYAGCILAFMPLFGAQIPLAFVGALIFKANLPILVGLQLISNPLTVPFIYLTAFSIGDFLFSIFGDTGQMAQVSGLPEDTNLLKQGVYNVTVMMVGGMIIGYFAEFISSLLYRIAAIRASRSLSRMSEIRQIKSAKSSDSVSTAQEA